MNQERQTMKTVLPLGLLGLALVASAAQPNVILIMTDDQGYGDLA